jgi:hypothetical protein
MSVLMPVRSWLRLHGSRLLAQVDPFGLGKWKAYARVDGGRTVPSPRQFEFLTSADVIADHMVRKEFTHCCEVESVRRMVDCRRSAKGNALR